MCVCVCCVHACVCTHVIVCSCVRAHVCVCACVPIHIPTLVYACVFLQLFFFFKNHPTAKSVSPLDSSVLATPHQMSAMIQYSQHVQEELGQF